MSKNSNKSGEGSTAIVKADAAPSLMTLVATFTKRISSVISYGERIYGKFQPLISTVNNYVWFLGSSALLLSLPVIVEIQRETTVLVMQKQKEQEMAQIQEQARAANAGALENMKSLAGMMMGDKPAAA